jgi:hypothetical protein
MKFIVVDNRSSYITILRKAILAAGYPESAIWPTDDRAVSQSWDEVLEGLGALKGTAFDGAVETCVLLIDLALDKADAQYSEGAAKIQAHAKGILEPYVLIVCSLWPTRAPAAADAVLDKREIEMGSGRGEAALRAALGIALDSWTVRTKRIAPTPARRWKWNDSIAARRADAALGSSIVSELVAREATDWRDVRVSALTGGYSGSYVLKVDGSVNDAAASVVVKLSRDRRSVEREMSAWKRAMSLYHAFVGLIPPQSEAAKLEGRGDAWYVVQSTVPGVTLERMLLDAGVVDSRKLERSTLGRGFRDLVRASRASVEGTLTKAHPARQLRFTTDDVDRYGDSLRELAALENECVSRDYCAPCIQPMIDRMKRIVQDWDAVRQSSGLQTVPCYQQHGDLNPRNVMVTDSVVQLIDFARVDLWPVGYDISRLELQTGVRVLDVASGADMFAENMKEWEDLWRDAESMPAAKDRSTTPGAFRAMLRMTGRWRQEMVAVCERNGIKRETFEKTWNFARCYDLLRMCSYQDVSPFKRLWALRLAVTVGVKAGILHK